MIGRPLAAQVSDSRAACAPGEWPPKPILGLKWESGPQEKSQGASPERCASFYVIPYQSNATRGQSRRAD